MPTYTERPNNTPEQVRAYLRERLAIVEELDPPEDLRALCFEKAVDYTAGKQIIAEQVSPMILGGVRPPGV